MPVVVEVVPLAPQLAGLTGVRLPNGATVADALAALDIHPPEAVTLGVWGRPVDKTEVLRDGDRIEFYRPLQCDPKSARRARAGRRSR